MQVNSIEFPAVRIAYRRIIGYGPAISTLWQEFNCWHKEKNLPYINLFGISHDDPSYTPIDQCRYDAATEVSDDFVADGEIQITHLPGGLYAALDFYGLPTECPAAWQALMNEWLPHYLPSDAYDENTGAFACRICIPVKAKTQ
jgi:DNA gyrase inhibitor GyrI